MNIFTQKYIDNWRKVEDGVPYPLIRRVMAEIILRSHAKQLIRHTKPIKEVVFPKWYLKQLQP